MLCFALCHESSLNTFYTFLSPGYFLGSHPLGLLCSKKPKSIVFCMLWFFFWHFFSTEQKFPLIPVSTILSFIPIYFLFVSFLTWAGQLIGTKHLHLIPKASCLYVLAFLQVDLSVCKIKFRKCTSWVAWFLYLWRFLFLPQFGFRPPRYQFYFSRHFCRSVTPLDESLHIEAVTIFYHIEMALYYTNNLSLSWIQ